MVMHANNRQTNRRPSLREGTCLHGAKADHGFRPAPERSSTRGRRRPMDVTQSTQFTLVYGCWKKVESSATICHVLSRFGGVWRSSEAESVAP
jgi:hypothetical protein